MTNWVVCASPARLLLIGAEDVDDLVFVDDFGLFLSFSARLCLGDEPAAIGDFCGIPRDISLDLFCVVYGWAQVGVLL